ncbi:hypothetical protein SAMN05421690_100354 [Nitrosomonas sp. Nm51]|uniref:hypothetical protein n=1 Tax=Nitrosomonas sp. Nm51 TaxID=133720 RepID=UPI0008CAB853|nr:hypothetical protein [Nitrosomonas sp. Nm51]SEQ89838.1 hypothetical protein SAMN05421690_100354 [Nitrosomonas sp. Nm51]
MNMHADKKPENENKSVEENTAKKQKLSGNVPQFVDNRPETAARNKLRETINGSERVKQLAAIQKMVNNSIRTKQQYAISTLSARTQPAAGNDKASLQANAKTNVVQRHVIQLQYDADAKLESVKTKKDETIEKLKAANYSEVIKLHAEIKEITQDLYERRALSSQKDKVFNRHTDGSSECLKAVIKAFQEIPQPEVNELAQKFENLFVKYEPLYHAAYDQIANAIATNNDFKESSQKIESIEKQHREQYSKLEKLFKPIYDFNEALKKDEDIQYSLGKDRSSSISGSALKTLDFTNIKKFYKKNRELFSIQLKQKKTTIKDFEKDTENEPLREKTALILLAGTEERKSKIVELFKNDFDKQLQIFNRINKNHRTDPIEDVVKLIKDAGADNIVATLGLIEKAGNKGSIAEINAFQEQAKGTKDKPSLTNAAGFLDGLEYESLTRLTRFMTAVGRVCGLAAIKSLWEKAAENNHIDETIAFFAGTYIPETLAGSEAEIGLAFAQKTGNSSPADWGKLLNIGTWEKEHLLALVKAFDKNNGNATAEQWVNTAKTDPALKTKPDEVRATTRLNMFANEEWYDSYDISKKGSSAQKAQKKYTQLLYALLGDKNLTGLGDISFDNIRGDFLSMLIFFHRHIASFDAGMGQGFDREKAGEGKYARSNKDHPLNEQYKDLLSQEGVYTKDLLQPLNPALLGLQDGGWIKSTGTKGAATYRRGQKGVASAGLPSHNLKILQDQQEIIGVSSDKKKAKGTFFKDPKLDTAPKISRSVDDDASITDTLIEKQEEALKDKTGGSFANKNFHDGLLQDRGALITQISTVINSISGGNQVLNAIGSEGHPSLILKVPKPAKYKYKNTDYDTTKQILPDIVADFNSASGQEIKITERGSFGFQRPTIADTGESVRLWPGYAPVESLLPGLKALVENLANKKTGVPLTKIDDLDNLKTDTKQPVLYIEALKTAMRHAFIVLKHKIDSNASDEKTRVYEWLKSRMLIKLQQAGILLTKGNTLYDGVSTPTQKEKNKHFAMTADMTDKLQEYAMLLSAATLDNTVNPNISHTTPGKFKDTDDLYEKKVISKLNAADYRVFYLDSGEQALVAAGILANRFQQGKDESDTKVEKSEYISKNPYFEIGVFGGDRRSNLEKSDTGKIVHADLSPVITEGRTTPKPKSETQTEVKRTWQDAKGDVNKRDVIPVIDITNSSIDEAVNLGKMPDNFIIVESLTKHQQLGADKFIMGRLIAVSNTEGTKTPHPLVKTNFLDLAQKIVGPVANEAYNPLLAKIRANMDKALYSDDLT